MTATMRQSILLVLLVILLLYGAFWAWDCRDQSRRRWAAALAETETCRQLSASIQQLRRGETLADQTPMAEDQLYQDIHQAAQSAGMDEQKVIRRITPQSARASSAGSQQKTVELSLQGLTLVQLTTFAHHIHASNPRLQVTAMTIHEPKGLGSDCLWNVEPLVLSYRISANTMPDHTSSH